MASWHEDEPVQYPEQPWFGWLTRKSAGGGPKAASPLTPAVSAPVPIHEAPPPPAKDVQGHRFHGFLDLTLHCPVCGQRADMCFAHGDDWKKRPMPPLYKQTDAQLRAGVNEFTQDDPPPYDGAA